ALPPCERLGRREPLLALGAALRAPDALLGLAGREIERLVRRLRLLLGLGPALARTLEQARGGGGRLELCIRIDAARDLEQRLAPGGRLRIEQARHTIEPSRSDARERRRLLGREARRARSDLLPDRALGQTPERDGLAARPDRLRQRAEVVGDKDDDGVRRRPLEI